MDSFDIVRNDFNALRNITDLKEREFKRKRDEVASALKPKREEISHLRAEEAILLTPPLLANLAVIKTLWSLLRRPAIRRILLRRTTLEREIKKLISDGTGFEKNRKAWASLNSRIIKASDAVLHLDHPPEDIREDIVRASEKVTQAIHAKNNKALVQAAKDMIIAVASWAKNTSQSRTQNTHADSARIWLPIPASMSYQAVKMGAKHDESVRNGSGFYVTFDDPLARFNSLLPHAFRETRPKLKFANMPHTAVRQNLWSFLDPLSWDHIRNVNYAMTGRRCILCGKQSGGLVKRLEPDKPHKVGSVECHEVWNWTRPDPDLPVGIQSLERIMVVCYECHMTFHDEFAAQKALAIGGEDLKGRVEGHLTQLRSHLTHMTAEQITLDMQMEKEKLASFKEVTNWIVDLSKLGKQDYMFGQMPTLLENNPAGVKSSQLAGLAFRDEYGAVHQAVSPERLYQETAMKFIAQPEPTYQVISPSKK